MRKFGEAVPIRFAFGRRSRRSQGHFGKRRQNDGWRRLRYSNPPPAPSPLLPFAYLTFSATPDNFSSRARSLWKPTWRRSFSNSFWSNHFWIPRPSQRTWAAPAARRRGRCEGKRTPGAVEESLRLVILSRSAESEGTGSKESFFMIFQPLSFAFGP